MQFNCLHLAIITKCSDTQTLLAQQNKLWKSSLQLYLLSLSIDEITFENFILWYKFMISKEVYLIQFRVESTSPSICTVHACARARAHTHTHIYIYIYIYIYILLLGVCFHCLMYHTATHWCIWGSNYPPLPPHHFDKQFAFLRS